MENRSDDIKWQEIGYAVNKILSKIKETESEIKNALDETEQAIKLAFGSADTMEPLIQASESHIKTAIVEASDSIKDKIPVDDISAIKEMATICKENLLSENHGLQALKEAIESGSIEAIIEAKEAIIEAISSVETNVQEMISNIPTFTTTDRAKADIDGNPFITTYAKIDYVNQSYANGNAYTDAKIAELINDAPETLDTLGEIAAAMAENADIVAAINAAIGSKASAAEFESHENNSTIHTSASEKQNINTKFEELEESLNGKISKNGFSDILEEYYVYHNQATNFSGDIDTLHNGPVGGYFVTPQATGTRPWNGYFNLIVFQYTGCQLAMSYNGNGNPVYLAFRNGVNSVWTPWRYLVSADQLNNSWIDLIDAATFHYTIDKTTNFKSSLKYNRYTHQVIGILQISQSVSNQSAIVTLPSLEGIGENKYIGLCGSGNYVYSQNFYYAPRISGNIIYSSHTANYNIAAGYAIYNINFVAQS